MKAKVAFAALGFLLAAPLCFSWSFLTHETIIDMTWESGIKPVLLRQYPDTTPEQLRTAHAYAYGGSVIQDAGYYPFGHPSFSNLTHYVRTGDFITNLIHQAHNVNELAFALGALSHYVGDTMGHMEAVNPAVAVEFPNLAKKYGPVVTYEQSPCSHIRTEFAFDIDQLSHARFAPAAYLRHVGFKVPLDLLERAFYVTYGLRLNTVIGNESHAIDGYDWSVRQFLPRVAYAEVLLHRKSFPPTRTFPAFPSSSSGSKKRLPAADGNRIAGASPASPRVSSRCSSRLRLSWGSSPTSPSAVLIATRKRNTLRASTAPPTVTCSSFVNSRKRVTTALLSPTSTSTQATLPVPEPTI